MYTLHIRELNNTDIRTANYCDTILLTCALPVSWAHYQTFINISFHTCKSDKYKTHSHLLSSKHISWKRWINRIRVSLWNKLIQKLDNHRRTIYTRTEKISGESLQTWACSWRNILSLQSYSHTPTYLSLIWEKTWMYACWKCALLSESCDWFQGIYSFTESKYGKKGSKNKDGKMFLYIY